MALMKKSIDDIFDVEIKVPWDDTSIHMETKEFRAPEFNMSDYTIMNPTIKPSIKSTDFSITFNENTQDFDLYKWYDYWITLSSSFDPETTTVDITARVQTKRFPYKHKTKRLKKKWFKQHSKIMTFYNCKISEQKD